MKYKLLGYFFLFITVLGAVTPVSAHSLTTKTLRAAFGASATDVWQVTCNSDAVLGNSDHLVAQILDRSGDNNFLPLVITKGTNAVTTVDPIGGDATLSPEVALKGGNGNYLLIVSYTRPLNQVYNIEYHCQNARGDHTPTTQPTTAVQDN